MTLISVTDAKEKLLSKLPVLGYEIVDLLVAHQRILADDIYAPIDSPRFTNSSMDGFAVRAEDIEDASEENPIKLKIVADIPAGHPSNIEIYTGETTRIMTGAQMPSGADAVVPIENTNLYLQAGEIPESVEIYRYVTQGGYIRPVGEDFKQDDLILTRGMQLEAQHVAMLANFGMSNISVYRKPRIGLFSTGDELVHYAEELSEGKIRDTNTVALRALCLNAGCEVITFGIVKDDPQAVRQTLQDVVAADVDMILSSAGVSVGAYDFVRDVIQERGEIDFWRVNMRPGKPFMFGSYEGIPYIGLPGNPVSSFVSFEVFVRSAMSYMGGRDKYERLSLNMILAEDIYSDGRESYLRVVLVQEEGILKARLTGHQGSGNMYSLVLANGMIQIPSGVKSIKAGAEVAGWFL